MAAFGPSRNATMHRILCSGWVILGLAALAGCENRTTTISTSDPQMAAFIRLMIPRSIEIRHYLTKPVSFEGGGNANGIEAILVALDAFGDPVKATGTFNFELYQMRHASADRHGDRIAFWTETIDSEQSLARNWDRLARMFAFRLQLPVNNLPPGDYILNAQLVTPTGEKLFDEYELKRESGAVSTAGGPQG